MINGISLKPGAREGGTVSHNVKFRFFLISRNFMERQPAKVAAFLLSVSRNFAQKCQKTAFFCQFPVRTYSEFCGVVITTQ